MGGLRGGLGPCMSSAKTATWLGHPTAGASSCSGEQGPTCQSNRTKARSEPSKSWVSAKPRDS